METQTKYQNVNGAPLLLTITKHGNSNQCRGYSVEKQNQVCFESLSVKLLTGSIILFAMCVNFNHVTGIGISLVVSLSLLYSLVWEVKREDLLVIAPVGIQFTATFRLGQQITCFIPWHHVKDVLIIEAISMQRVVYNLVVYTESCLNDQTRQYQRLIPLYQGTKPRLACLEPIYQSVHDLLSNVQ